MRVKAIAKGHYKGLRAVGAVFNLEETEDAKGNTITADKQFSARWMVEVDADGNPVGDKAKAKPKKKPAAKAKPAAKVKTPPPADDEDEAEDEDEPVEDEDEDEPVEDEDEDEPVEDEPVEDKTETKDEGKNRRRRRRG